MNGEEFAAQRRAVFVRVDDELLPSVTLALGKYGQGEADWDADLIEDASVIWLEVFQSEAPNADPDRFLPAFQKSIEDSLADTENTGFPPTEVSIARVTRWLGTYTVNDATYRAAGARGIRNKRWTTMHDAAVREQHVVADGQVRPIAAPFNVGGYELRFPGDPVGPAELWINCRCVIQPAAGREVANVSPTTFAITDETDIAVEPLDEDELPDDDLEDGEDEITEVPVHGVLAPEGVPTGDGRQFATDSLTHRDLPLPIAYQVMSAEGHANSVTVGRIDTIERVGNEMRFTGALMTNRQYYAEVMEGIIDGTVRGVSVDVDNVVVGEMSEDENGFPSSVEFAEARIAGVTIVPIPAFQEAFIGLGHEFASDLSEDDLEALAACGCQDGPEDLEENEDVVLAYDAYRNVSTDERKDRADDGTALPDGSFPIANVSDLKNAIQAIGRAKDPAAAKAHIKKRARDLGHPELIPEDWAGETISASGRVLHGEFAPGTHDGPGWITHPIPTGRIRRSVRAGLIASGETAEHVLAVADRLQVIHADATPNSAEMVEFRRNLAVSDLPREAVREMVLALEASPAVTILRLDVAGPDEARSQMGRVLGLVAGGAPVTHELFKGGSTGTAALEAGVPLTLVVAQAEPTGKVLSLASFNTAQTHFAPGTHDGPGWITHPIPTQRIRKYWVHGKGAAKIRWGTGGDFNRCRRQLAKYIANPDWLAGACANMHYEALGFWPSTHRKLTRGHALVAGATTAPMFTLVAAATRTFPADFFTEPTCDPSVGVEVDGDHVYGYIAQWGVCHIGIDGICTTPPEAQKGYGYYTTGVVHTDDGNKVRVGQITMDTGHANLKANHRVAAAHYDNTGAAVADIAVGENAYGIWFSGVIRRNATEDQVHALEASGRLSGDWRKINGEWYMVAALAVNVPGFPIPEVALAASGGEQYALVAAGIIPVEPEKTIIASLDAETVAGIARTAVAEYRHLEKVAARVTPLRESLRQRRIETLRTKITKE